MTLTVEDGASLFLELGESLNRELICTRTFKIKAYKKIKQNFSYRNENSYIPKVSKHNINE